MLSHIKFAQFNDLGSVERLLTANTCAIFMETVQGEGGIYPASPEFLRGVRRLCDQRGILMVSDEIQCGMGCSGAMFAYQTYGVQPDIVVAAKALGLMKGIELREPAGSVIQALQQAGVLVIPSGTHVIRLLPPLILQEEHIDQLMQALDGVM